MKDAEKENGRLSGMRETHRNVEIAGYRKKPAVSCPSLDALRNETETVQK